MLQLPVYDAHGNRIAFHISAVNPEGEKGIDLLTTKQLAYRVDVRQGDLYFPAGLVGKRRLEITLENGHGARLTRRVALMDCKQRTSVEFGSTDTGADTSSSTVKGQLTGCALSGDWWVRAVPMFGALENPIVHEGIVLPSDGTFRITSSWSGERYIVIIGKDKQPIRAIGADLVAGGNADLGSIDLRGLCPH